MDFTIKADLCTLLKKLTSSDNLCLIPTSSYRILLYCKDFNKFGNGAEEKW